MLLVVVVVVVVIVACFLWRGGCNSVIGCSVRSAPHLAAPLSQSEMHGAPAPWSPHFGCKSRGMRSASFPKTAACSSRGSHGKTQVLQKQPAV